MPHTHPLNPPFWTEAERLAALRAYDILDTPREDAFDGIARLLAAVFEAPIALVNLIDADRAWFKAEVGTGMTGGTIQTSFCAVAIRDAVDDVMVVPDAALDLRFADNAFVKGPPGLRFYAGRLLKTPEGLPLGALCVHDVAARSSDLTPLQALALEVLAGEVMDQLELRRALKSNRRSEQAVQQALVESDLMSQELSHRIKNIFAVVSALISLSAREHPQARAFAAGVKERLGALARAHEFVRPHTEASRPSVGTMTLHAFLEALFGAYVDDRGAPRVLLSGEDAGFDDQAATSVALLFHELATNAAKYGALSVKGGRVDLSTHARDDRFVLTWTERDGPAVRGPPERAGFGTSLATISVEKQLSGRLERSWLTDGLVVVADLPATALMRRRAAMKSL